MIQSEVNESSDRTPQHHGTLLNESKIQSLHPELIYTNQKAPEEMEMFISSPVKVFSKAFHSPDNHFLMWERLTAKTGDGWVFVQRRYPLRIYTWHQTADIKKARLSEDLPQDQRTHKLIHLPIQTYIHTHQHTLTRIHTHSHAHTYKHTQTHMYSHTCTCANMCTQTKFLIK